MLVVFALAIPVLLGMAAIVVDVGNLFVEKRSLQKAADASALAAAQKLPCPDAACQSGVATLAGNYRAANLGDGNSSPLPVCDASTTSNCHRIIGNARVEVILTKEVSTFFGGLIGKSSYTVRARAVAGPFAYTGVEPGSTVTNPGSTNPDTIITTPGQDVPALMFVKSSACDALTLSGDGSRFYGAVMSNGGVKAISNDIGGGPLIYVGPPSCLVLGNNNSWGTPIVRAPTDWPVPPPICTTATSAPGVNACNPTTAAAGAQITTVGGVPCTPAPADDWKITAPITAPPGAGLLYCAKKSIEVIADLTNVGLVAPSISAKGYIVSGTDLLPSYGGLMFYAYGGVPGVDEVDRVTINRASGGTFTLSFGGQTTGPLAHDAAAGTVQTALRALSTIGPGNVNVASSTQGQNQFYDVTFVGDLAGTDVGPMSANGALLTGNSASASVQTTTPGATYSETGSWVVDASSQGFSSAGAIYAPFGHVDLTGSGTQARCPDPTAGGCGFIEAWTLRLAGAGAIFQGLGPGTGGPPTTTTIPGSTDPGSTTTNPDVTITTGTGSNLDE